MQKSGLTLCVLTLFLSACSPKCPPPRSFLPPVVYLQEVAEPKLGGRTNKDLLEWSVNLREALRQSNSDKAALRDWYEEMSLL